MGTSPKGQNDAARVGAGEGIGHRVRDFHRCFCLLFHGNIEQFKVNPTQAIRKRMTGSGGVFQKGKILFQNPMLLCDHDRMGNTDEAEVPWFRRDACQGFLSAEIPFYESKLRSQLPELLEDACVLKVRTAYWL